jgi:hypothetical protein
LAGDLVWWRYLGEVSAALYRLGTQGKASFLVLCSVGFGQPGLSE